MQKDEKQMNIIDNWRQGRLATTSTASTIALSIILIATLCSAQYAIKKPLATGNNIYTTIKQDGLSKYIDPSNAIHYYFEKLNLNSNVDNGAILHHAVKQGANGLEHTMTRFSFFREHIVVEELTIGDHLDYYDARIYTIIIASGTIVQNLHHTMHGNAYRTVTKEQDILTVAPVIMEDYIHYLMLDLFTSIGITKFKHTSFSLNFIDQIGFPQSIYVYTLDSNDIRDTNTAIMTIYHQFGKSVMRQDLLFDANHNLIAQNDFVSSIDPRKPDAFKLRVEMKQFLAAYPDALVFLENWLEKIVKLTAPKPQTVMNDVSKEADFFYVN